MKPKTLFDKIWDYHLISTQEDGASLIYIDRHLVHEVTSPQAFEGLRMSGRVVNSPNRTLAVADHNVPTTDRTEGIQEEESRIQVEALDKNVEDFGVPYFNMMDKRQGIVHVIGPEQGFTQPGMTIVCGDSHTATHGAFGALAFGIGTSEVEHVMATQTLLQSKPKTFELRVDGDLGAGVTAKDLILYLIGEISTHGGTGFVLEYTGTAIQALTMEERMTVCNMSIEAGARAGMIAPDDITYRYLEGREFAPKGADFEKAVERWRQLSSDPGASYDRSQVFAAEDIAPQVTWGTNPGQVIPVVNNIPDPTEHDGETERKTAELALEYMGIKAGTPMTEIPVNRVFIGSCTNGRIEDLRAAASVVRGHKVSESVYAMVVPGSGQVKEQAESEGLDKVFQAAGFDWRDAGCSMCLAMNPDKLTPGERCASTSNRNFEGRQGKGGRTHLCSPAMAAAAAVLGHFVDVRDWDFK